MKRLATVSTVLAVVFLLAMAGIPTNQFVRAQSQVVTERQLTGQLRINNRPVGTAGIVVTLRDSGGAEVNRAMSDSAGRFRFEHLRADSYEVIVQQHEYRYFTREVDLNFSPSAFVYVDLIPVPGQNVETAPPGASISAKLPANDTARQEFERGQEILASSKDPKESISHLQKAMKAEPTFEPTYVLLGKAYMDEKNWKDAETALRKGADLDPKDFAASFMLGACLNQERDFAGAEKALLHSLDIDPKAVEGHYELARTYFSLNQWDKAEPQVTQALRLNPQFAPAHVAMGNIFLRKGDAASAQAEYEQYLKLNPDGIFAPGVKATLAKIKSASSAQRP